MLALHHLKNNYFGFRHGHSEANEQGIIISDPVNGVEGYGLTPKGQNEVILSIKSLSSDNLPSVIISSDFKRTHESATIVAATFSLQPQPSENLRERFFGDFEKHFNEHYESIWQADKTLDFEFIKQHQVETCDHVASRIMALIHTLESQHSHENIYLFSHGDTLQIAQSVFLNKPPHLHRSHPHINTAECKKLSP